MNNRGWGFVPFILLLLLLISALFFTSFLVNNFEKRLAEKKDNIATTKELEIYKKYEEDIANEAIKHYTDDEIIPLSLLPLQGTIKQECKGYAKKSGNLYKGYISCGKYTTLGYSDRFLEK